MRRRTTTCRYAGRENPPDATATARSPGHSADPNPAISVGFAARVRGKGTATAAQMDVAGAKRLR